MSRPAPDRSVKPSRLRKSLDLLTHCWQTIDPNGSHRRRRPRKSSPAVGSRTKMKIVLLPLRSSAYAAVCRNGAEDRIYSAEKQRIVICVFSR